MHPVGPLSSRTYWARRLLLVAVAVLMLIGVVWFLIGRSAARSSGTSDPGSAAVADTGTSRPSLTGVLATPTTTPTAPSTTPSTTATTEAPADPATPSTAATTPGPETTAPGTDATTPPTDTTAPPTDTTAPPTDTTAPAAADAAAPADPATPATSDPAPDPAAAPAADQPPAAPGTPAPPSYDAQGRLLCSDEALSVVASSAQPRWSTGAQPVLGMTVTNTGGQACVRDLSGPLQVFTVVDASGGHVWSTADCFPGTGTDVRELAPGASASFSVRWSGTTSTPGCAGERVPVAAGSYRVITAIGGRSGTAADFTIG